MTQEEFKKFLEENATSEDVQKIIGDYAPKPKLEDLLQSEDYSKKFQSLLDSEKTKAVEAFKEKTLPKRVEEEVAKKLEQKNHKDPWQIKLEEMQKQQEELQKKLEDKEKAEQRERLRNKALQTASEKGLPSNMVDYFLGEDEDSTVENLNLFEKTLSEYGKKIKEGVYKNKNTDVPSKESTTSAQGTPGPNASKEEWIEYYKKQGK